MDATVENWGFNRSVAISSSATWPGEDGAVHRV